MGSYDLGIRMALRCMSRSLSTSPWKTSTIKKIRSTDLKKLLETNALDPNAYYIPCTEIDALENDSIPSTCPNGEKIPDIITLSKYKENQLVPNENTNDPSASSTSAITISKMINTSQALTTQYGLKSVKAYVKDGTTGKTYGVSKRGRTITEDISAKTSNFIIKLKHFTL